MFSVQKFQKIVKMGSETLTIFVDEIGEILYDTDCFSLTEYIEEILGVFKFFINKY